MRRGFTLLEVVLALTLSIALAVAVMVFYSQATSTRSLVAKDSQQTASRRIVMDRLGDELGSSLNYSFLGLALEGTVDPKTKLPQVRFVTALPPSPSAWATREASQAPLPPRSDLQIVGYSLSTWEDKEGQLHVGGLQRSCQNMLTAKTVEEGTTVNTQSLSSDIKFMQLRYWDGAAWADQWNQGDLPLAVEITLGLAQLPENTDPSEYPFATWKRTVYLPTGSKAMGTLIIQTAEGRQP